MSLASLLRRFRGMSTDARVIVLGLDNSGKTTILKRLSNEDITQTMPTKGFYIKSLIQDGFKLNCWDIGGQRSIRAYWRNYYNGTDGIVTSTYRRRMEETGIELQQILDEEKLDSVPILILANKQDLLNSLSPSELASGLSLHSIRDRRWQICGCSAKTGEGIQEGMDFIVQCLIERTRPS